MRKFALFCMLTLRADGADCLEATYRRRPPFLTYAPPAGAAN
jgi:hypothetical protein